MKAKEKISSMSIEAKASVAYILCSVIQRGAAILMLPVFTRVMTTEQYGLTSVYLSWVSFFAIILSLNLPYGSLQTAMVKFENRRNEYIASLEGIYILLALLFVAIYLPFQEFWNSLLGLPTILVISLVCEVFATSCIQSWMGMQRFSFKYKSVFLVTTTLAVCSQAIALAFVLCSDDKGVAKVVGSAFTTFVFGISIALMCARRGGGIIHKDLWRYALGFNIPLIVYYLSQVVFNQSDIIMINYYAGADKAGIYSVAYSVSMVLTFVINAIQGSYTPWFYGKLVKHREIEDRGVAVSLSAGLAFALFLVVLAAPEIVLLLGGPNYIEAIWVVPPVAASVLLLFYACLFDRLFFFYERKAYLTFAVVVPALVNIVLNVLLIPGFGYLAAGYTTLVSYLVLVALDIALAFRLSRQVRFDMKAYAFKQLFVVFVVFVAASAVAMGLYACVLARLLVFLLMVCAVIANKGKIIGMLHEIRK